MEESVDCCSEDALGSGTSLELLSVSALVFGSSVDGLETFDVVFISFSEDSSFASFVS